MSASHVAIIKKKWLKCKPGLARAASFKRSQTLNNLAARHGRMRLVLLETFGFWAQLTALKGPDSILQLQ